MDDLYNIAELTKLRRELHKNPELSGKEKETAKRVKSFLKKHKPDKIVEDIGGHGIAAVFQGNTDGPSVLFRCDLDALPISETNTFNYKSKNKGVAHKCGHDGHMTIITGLAQAIANNRPQKGRVILLYQPSEENGMGAGYVLEDPKFESIKPDFVYALHNLPGFPKKSIITNHSIFASASKGMIIRLHGKTSHAGEPENGNSPAIAMADLVKELTYLPNKEDFKSFTLITVIHARLGEIAFGTTPGYAEVMATLRAHTNEDMEKLSEKAMELVEYHTKVNNLKYETEWTEEFLATENNNNAVNIVQKAGEANELNIIKRNEPFRWSEDFSRFTKDYPGALFGLGAGEETPQLHNPDYDFPEEIIETGIKVFYEIYKEHFNQ
jgi:amidohydrolase